MTDLKVISSCQQEGALPKKFTTYSSSHSFHPITTIPAGNDPYKDIDISPHTTYKLTAVLPVQYHTLAQVVLANYLGKHAIRTAVN